MTDNNFSSLENNHSGVSTKQDDEYLLAQNKYLTSWKVASIFLTSWLATIYMVIWTRSSGYHFRLANPNSALNIFTVAIVLNFVVLTIVFVLDSLIKNRILKIFVCAALLASYTYAVLGKAGGFITMGGPGLSGGMFFGWFGEFIFWIIFFGLIRILVSAGSYLGLHKNIIARLILIIIFAGADIYLTYFALIKHTPSVLEFIRGY